MLDQGGSASAPAGTTLTSPGGRPASRHNSPNRSAASGASSEGLNTTAFPAANAGATHDPATTSEPFHGAMTPTTPYGSRSTRLTSNEPLTGVLVPCSLSAYPAKWRRNRSRRMALPANEIGTA